MADASFPVRICETEGNKHAHIIDINGVLDIHTTRLFETVLNELLDGDTRWIIINFNNCSYISSAGLGAIMSGAKQLVKIFAQPSETLVHGARTIFVTLSMPSTDC